MKKKANHNYRSAIRLLKAFLLGIAFILLLPQWAAAQFTYVGGSIGVMNNIIGNKARFPDDRAINYGLCLNAKVLYRPLRFLGVGAEFSFPVTQKTEANFSNIPTTGHSGFGTSIYDNYDPKKFDYLVNQSFNSTLFARFFTDTRVHFHADLRFSYTSFKEEFDFERAAAPPEESIFGDGFNRGALSALDIFYEEQHNVPSVGIGLGFMPHVTDHLFLDFNIGLDFLIMGSEPGFSYQIEYDWNYSGQYHEYATLESQFTGIKPCFFMNIGLGYYF